MPISPTIAALLQQARDQECQRIAAELHDDIGGHLLGLKMALARVQRHLAQGTPPDPLWLREQITYLETLTNASLEATARISQDLQPPLLQAGLTAALDALCAGYARQSGIPCELSGAGVPVDLPPFENRTLYLICREALNNVGKHANATLAKIQLRADETGLLLEISDNGIGLPAQLEPGLGLPGMQARAHAIGASLRLLGTPGGGTTWQIRLPANPETTSRQTGLPPDAT